MVIYSWIELSKEETFNWEVKHGIDKISESSSGVKSYVELSWLRLEIAGNHQVGSLLNEVIELNKWSDEADSDVIDWID